eukprot:GHVP01009733.1.p1 GENE.GHVP01009733.1~~GHVP01009733.1.p1  ORF type:complete len:628 (+),score=97.91 GHVP01009733.1:38-1921(+)
MDKNTDLLLSDAQIETNSFNNEPSSEITFFPIHFLSTLRRDSGVSIGDYSRYSKILGKNLHRVRPFSRPAATDPPKFYPRATIETTQDKLSLLKELFFAAERAWARSRLMRSCAVSAKLPKRVIKQGKIYMKKSAKFATDLLTASKCISSWKSRLNVEAYFFYLQSIYLSEATTDSTLTMKNVNTARKLLTHVLRGLPTEASNSNFRVDIRHLMEDLDTIKAKLKYDAQRSYSSIPLSDDEMPAQSLVAKFDDLNACPTVNVSVSWVSRETECQFEEVSRKIVEIKNQIKSLRPTCWIDAENSPNFKLAEDYSKYESLSTVLSEALNLFIEEAGADTKESSIVFERYLRDNRKLVHVEKAFLGVYWFLSNLLRQLKKSNFFLLESPATGKGPGFFLPLELDPPKLMAILTSFDNSVKDFTDSSIEKENSFANDHASVMSFFEDTFKAIRMIVVASLSAISSHMKQSHDPVLLKNAHALVFSANEELSSSSPDLSKVIMKCFGEDSLIERIYILFTSVRTNILQELAELLSKRLLALKRVPEWSSLLQSIHESTLLNFQSVAEIETSLLPLTPKPIHLNLSVERLVYLPEKAKELNLEKRSSDDEPEKELDEDTQKKGLLSRMVNWWR